MDSTVLLALLLSFLAGSATLLGGFVSFFVKRDDLKIFSIGMGFSAGVMIYVSFMEMLPTATENLALVMSQKAAGWATIGAFFGGILIAGIIDQLIPQHHLENKEFEPSFRDAHIQKIRRIGLFTALALAVHNFPEGLATFMSAINSPQLGISIAIAVAIHNIPEGIAVAVPIYNATGSRKSALLYSGLSGMAEPVGALIGWAFLSRFLGPVTFGVVFALVAGIMIYISFDELLPTANEYGDGHKEILGVIAGMLVMAISLVLF
ncbi:ZIP family zinc transporter [Elusimicrobium simillimum]|uniref:zinc transporter ZupT n=1 Tax=Elusimicrobium simillimum TaxID=3143438 RepID=UPI003C703BFD